MVLESNLPFLKLLPMEIDHLGEAVVEQLVEKGLVKDPADLYKLTRQQILTLDLMADKSADNLLAALETGGPRPA